MSLIYIQTYEIILNYLCNRNNDRDKYINESPSYLLAFILCMPFYRQHKQLSVYTTSISIDVFSKDLIRSYVSSIISHEISRWQIRKLAPTEELAIAHSLSFSIRWLGKMLKFT